MTRRQAKMFCMDCGKQSTYTAPIPKLPACVYCGSENTVSGLSGLPIKAITDGWILNNGDLHLLVHIGGMYHSCVSIPRFTCNGERQTTKNRETA